MLSDSVEGYEKTAFLDGTTFSIRVLISLLQEKYRYQKSVTVNSKVVFIEEGTDFVLPDSEHSGDYELFVIAYQVKSKPFLRKTLLLIKPRDKEEPWVLLTIPEHKPRPLNKEVRVRYITNNLFNKKLVDNAYAIFDFLNAYFGGDAMASDTLYERIDKMMTQERQARLIEYELSRPLRIRNRIIALYREINELLVSTADTAILIETKKQLLFQVIESATFSSEPRPKDPLNTSEMATKYIPLPYLDRKLDPIPSENVTANNLLVEMLTYITFITRVVAQAPSHRYVREEEHSLSLQIGEKLYPVSVVRTHITHLRYRLLAHIDTLNIRSISPLREHQLRFTQKEYRLLKDEQFISFPVMQHILNLSSPALPKDVALIGPDAVTLFMDGKDTVRLPAMIAKKTTLIFVIAAYTLETQDLYYSLLVIQKQEPSLIVKYLPTLYIAKGEFNDLTWMQNQSARLFRKLQLPGLISELQVIPNPGASLAPFYSSWHTLLLLKALHHELARTDLLVLDRVTATLIQYEKDPLLLFSTIETILHSIDAGILSSYFGDTSMSFEVGPRVALSQNGVIQSSISTLVKLSFQDEYIDDNLLTDMISSLPIMPHIAIQTPTQWRGVIELDYNIKRKDRKRDTIFNDPSLQLFLMPINIVKTSNKDPSKILWSHWALGVIDLSLHIVSYYSSIDDDYYAKFSEIVLDFLAKQTPGITYTVRKLTGPQQSVGCVDCALFVLNMISKLAVPTELRVAHTRASVTFYITEELVKLWKRTHEPFIKDLVLFYYDVKRQDIWSTISGYRDRLNTYREKYLNELMVILQYTELYTFNSIKALLSKLSKLRDQAAQLLELESELTTLFNETLVLWKDEEEVKKRKFDDEEDKQGVRKKSRTSSVLLLNKEETIDVIRRMAQEIEDNKMNNDELDSYAAYYEEVDFINDLLEMAEPLPEEIDRNALISALIESAFNTNDLTGIIEAFVVSEGMEEDTV